MENDEKTDGVQVEEKENDTVGTEVTTGEGDDSSRGEDDSSSEVTVEARLAALEAEAKKAKAEAAKYRRLFEKGQKPDVSRKGEDKAETPPISVNEIDERLLVSNGMPDELLSKLKKLATVNGTSLIEAQKDPIFVAMKGEYEKAEKRKAEAMPASRGSGQSKVKENFSTPGLTKEKHKELWKSNHK